MAIVTLAETEVCAWRPHHDRHRDVPWGPPCGGPAVAVILWLDGSDRWSTACGSHLDLDPEAPPHRIVAIPDLEFNDEESA